MAYSVRAADVRVFRGKGAPTQSPPTAPLEQERVLMGFDASADMTMRRLVVTPFWSKAACPHTLDQSP